MVVKQPGLAGKTSERQKSKTGSLKFPKGNIAEGNGKMWHQETVKTNLFVSQG